MTDKKMKTVAANAQHHKFRRALEQAIADHGKEMDAIELLAITSHFVGQMIALQDQRKYTPAMVTQLVAANIEAGNKEAVDKLKNETGGTA